MSKVKSVDVFTGNPGAAGFRRGDWMATLDDGRQFVFWDSVSHSATLEEQEAILKKNSANDFRKRQRGVYSNTKANGFRKKVTY